MTRVGVVGLGRMGAPMANNLLRAGFPVALWNRSRAKAEEVAAGTDARVCDTPRSLAEASDVVLTMLADDAASHAVHVGEDGLFAATDGASVLFEMGTLSVDHLVELGDAGRGRLVIDAPVSGSVDAAADAQLLVMVGAAPEEIDAFRPVLASISRRIICLGNRRAGAAMKLAVNLVIHGLNQSIAEALVLAEEAGVDLASAYEVIENSAAAAPMVGYRKPQYLDEAASPVSFALSLARKDLELALALGRAVDVPMPQTALNADQLRAAESAGFGDRDMAAVLSYLRGNP
ncbi:MAG: NAD(P)-dependent oxidoreductase [Acidimicrobiales bacterium]